MLLKVLKMTQTQGNTDIARVLDTNCEKMFSILATSVFPMQDAEGLPE